MRPISMRTIRRLNSGLKYMQCDENDVFGKLQLTLYYDAKLKTDFQQKL